MPKRRRAFFRGSIPLCFFLAGMVSLPEAGWCEGVGAVPVQGGDLSRSPTHKVKLLEAQLIQARRATRPAQWRTWGPETGLSSTEIYVLLETPDGTLWAGGNQGLHRFDGFRWTPVPGAGTFCYSLAYEKSTKTLWAGFDDQVYQLREGSDSLKPYTRIAEAAIPRAALSFDGKNRLWVISEKGIFLRAGGDDWRQVPVRSVENLAYATPLLESARGELLLGTEEGLLVGTAADGFAPFPGAPTVQVLALAEDPTGRLWVATVDGLF